jgi:hypothetical protein
MAVKPCAGRHGDPNSGSRARNGEWFNVGEKDIPRYRTLTVKDASSFDSSQNPRMETTTTKYGRASPAALNPEL